MVRHILSLIIGLCVIQVVCLAQSPVHFRAIARTDRGFTACGDGDRIVLMDYLGSEIRSVSLPQRSVLNDIAYTDGVTVAVGDDGLVYYEKDGKHEFSSFPGKDLKCIGAFAGEFIMGIDNTILRLSEDLDVLSETALDLKGRITSLSCSSSLIIGSTDRNEIFTSSDAKRWSVVDFNREYDSFYRPMSVVGVAAGEASMAIAGVDSEGRPAMYFSSDGKVWAQRELSYLDLGTPVFIDSIPSGIAYDQDNDRMLLLLEDGGVFIVPGCSHCNSAVETGGSLLTDAAVYMGAFVVVGRDSFTYSSLTRL